jgi:16S rRNA (adenine(1408)-N(1))-methyltransferase
MAGSVTMVWGRRIERVEADALADLIGKYRAVVVDIGTGDGRWLYRLARARPDVLCLGIDASADGLRDVSHRAARMPARGGLANVRYILASVEAIPAALHRVADEAWVVYPWGSLLRAVVVPDPAVLRGIAGVLKPGGLFRAAINDSAIERSRIPEVPDRPAEIRPCATTRCAQDTMRPG